MFKRLLIIIASLMMTVGLSVAACADEPRIENGVMYLDAAQNNNIIVYGQALEIEGVGIADISPLVMGQTIDVQVNGDMFTNISEIVITKGGMLNKVVLDEGSYIVTAPLSLTDTVLDIKTALAGIQAELNSFQQAAVTLDAKALTYRIGKKGRIETIEGNHDWMLGKSEVKIYSYQTKAEEIATEEWARQQAAFVTEDTYYTVSFDTKGKVEPIPSQRVKAGGHATQPSSLTPYEQGDFLGWFTDSDCTDSWDFEEDAVTSDITLYLGWSNQCLAAGTLVTMADGSLKPIEEIKCGDMLRTFDHETGEISSSHVCYIWASEDAEGAFRLDFENSVSVTVVEEHGFYEKESKGYAFINQKNVGNYIGHSFYHADTGSWLKLTGYEILDKKVDSYSIITSQHFNTVSEGMLSMDDGTISALVKIFEYDDNLKYDPIRKAADIEKWGLMPREALEDYSEEAYIDYGFKYFPIVVGKGLLSWETINCQLMLCSE